MADGFTRKLAHAWLLVLRLYSSNHCLHRQNPNAALEKKLQNEESSSDVRSGGSDSYKLAHAANVVILQEPMREASAKLTYTF